MPLAWSLRPRPCCRPIPPPLNPNRTMNRRKQEMVQVTDELAVSRRLYGVLERLADRVGIGSVDFFLRDNLEATIMGVRESRRFDMRAEITRK